jgi:hypothetical protein
MIQSSRQQKKCLVSYELSETARKTYEGQVP